MGYDIYIYIYIYIDIYRLFGCRVHRQKLNVASDKQKQKKKRKQYLTTRGWHGNPSITHL